MKKLLLTLTLMLAAIVCSTTAKAVTVYYNNPNNWSAVCAYVYGTSGEAVKWPGEAMTKDGDLYKYVIPSGFESGQVIFNNNNQGSQYPAQDGLQLAGADMICLDNTIWTDYIDHSFTVYFDNSTEQWATPYVHYWGATGSEWPGVAMTNVSGDTWKYDVPAGTGAVIFTNGSTSATIQSGSFAAKEDHLYNKSGDQGVYDPSAPVDEDFVIYFDNTDANWTTPYVHYWGGKSESTWPGAAMETYSGNIWKCTVAAKTTGILFNAGDGDATKTGDFTATANHVYTQSGDQGDISTYTRTVTMPDALYILGNIGTTAWTTTPGITMTKEGNTFKAEGVEINAAEKGGTVGYFTFVTAVGADWDAVNASDRYGAATEDAPLTSGVAAVMAKYAAGVSASGAKSWELATGSYTIVADFENMKVTATKTGEGGPITGEGALTVPEITVEQGADATISIALTADDPILGVQFNVEVPDGFSLGAAVKTDRLTDHVVTWSTTTGKYLVTVYSPTNTEMSGSYGAIINIPLTCDANTATGTYTGTISNIIFSDKNFNKIKPDAVSFKVNVKEVSVSSITLNHTQLALQVGETGQLEATILPADAAVKTVTWVSNKEEVATVDATGLVTAVGKGTAVITAICGTLSATCTVTVGKTAQTITWDQDLDPIGVGETVTFTATASSGLPVTYAITSGSGNGSLADNVLTGLKVGPVSVIAQQLGDDTYAPAEPVTRTVTVWAGYYDGDVNGDNQITLADVTAIIMYIHGQNPTPFNALAADMDGDGVIDINDVPILVAKLLELGVNTTSGTTAMRSIASGSEEFTIQLYDDYTIGIDWTNQANYVATMFEISLPDGIEFSSAYVSGSNHGVSFKALDEQNYRMVVFSEDNSNFASEGGVRIVCSKEVNGDVRVSNILLNRIDGNSVIETSAASVSSSLTGIENVGVDAEGEAVYYNLQGVRVANPTTGVYIRRTANGASKVLIK